MWGDSGLAVSSQFNNLADFSTSPPGSALLMDSRHSPYWVLMVHNSTADLLPYYCENDNEFEPRDGNSDIVWIESNEL